MNEQLLATLVRQYQLTLHPRLNQELAFYRQLATINESIDTAVLAKLPNGKRHPHQRRLKRQVLECVRQHLLANKHQLEQSQSFEALRELPWKTLVLQSCFGASESHVPKSFHG